MAAKIKDGLFIGDADTSQDPEFLELNKISNLINFAGREIPNVWAAHGLVYNTYNWEDRDDFKLFDSKHEILSEIVVFVDKAVRHGASVLLFSTKGIGRCTAAVCAYLMFKYGWGFEKSYDFVYSKKPDIELNRGFVEQLFTLDKKLRHNRYQGREGNDLTQQEHHRIHEWDPSYLSQSVAAEEQGSDGKNSTMRKSLTASHMIPDTNSLDELLMVHSYLNSKMTITSLPGPFHDAMRQPKQFTLQINLANNQEAGVHLRRTLPPPLTSAPPRGGILKGGPNNYRLMAQKSSHKNKNSSQQKQTMRDLEEDSSSSLSDEDEQSRGGHSRRPVAAPSQPNSHQPSIETLSLHVPSQISQASDLYDFVGLTPQQQQQQQQQYREKKRGQTAEERLHNLLGDLQRGDRSSKGPPSAAQPKSVRSSIDRDTKQFSKQTAVSSVSTITPSSSSASIHDIASMPIQPSYQPPSQPSTRTRSYGASAATTPSSSNQPIKTNPQISIQRGRESKGEKQQPQAWIDSDPTSNDDPSLGGGLATTASSAYYNHSGKAKTRGPGGTSTRPNSATSTTRKTNTNGTPSQSYRHGSPAPQISRTGLASKTQLSQRERDDGSVDERDTRSIQSASSSAGGGNGTARVRGSTPTRQSTDLPGSGRSSTPLRQRAASPSLREREKSSTVTPAAQTIGLSPRDREEPNRRLSGGGVPSRENGTASLSRSTTTPLRERPESRERGGGTGGGGGMTNGTSTTTRGGTPSRGVRTDTATGRSSSPWTSTEREREQNGGQRGWKY